MRAFLVLAISGCALVVAPQLLRAQSAPGDSLESKDPAAASSPAATSAQQTQGKKRLLLLNLEALAVDPAVVRVIDGLLTEALHQHSQQIELLTAADMRQIMALEADKQNLGCSTDSCLSELAGAMGARYVVFGQVGKLDQLTLVQLNLFDSRDARSLGRQEIRTQNTAELADTIRPAVDQLLVPLLPQEQVKPESLSMLTLIGAGVAGVGVVAALGLGGGALWADQQLVRPGSEVNSSSKEDLLQVGPALLVSTGLAGLVAVGGGVVLALGLME